MGQWICIEYDTNPSSDTYGECLQAIWIEGGGESGCEPLWECEQPLNGYENDGCSHRRLNPGCQPSGGGSGDPDPLPAPIPPKPIKPLPFFQVPDVDFEYQILEGGQVKFTNKTIYGGACTYHWTFGDGSTSDLVNPLHVYSEANTFEVNLTATPPSPGVPAAETKNIVVTIEIEKVDFSYIAYSGTVAFTDTSTIRTISWLWNFGDGSTSTERNPVHDYEAGGTYSISLTINGRVTSKSVTVTANIDEPTYLISFGSWGTGDGQFKYAMLDVYNGKVYVADRENHYVSIFDTSGNFISKFAHSENALWKGEDIKVANDEIYVFADNFFIMTSAVKVFDLSGTYKRTIGSYGGQTRAGTGTYYMYCSLTVSDSHIFIADPYTPPSGHTPFILYALDGSFVGRYGEMGTFAGQINPTTGLAYLDYYDAKIYIASNGNTNIEVYDTSFNFLETLNSSVAPQNIRVDAFAVYVSTLNTTINHSAYNKDNGVLIYQIGNSPKTGTGIAVDADYIYVANMTYGSHASIRKYEKEFAIIPYAIIPQFTYYVEELYLYVTNTITGPATSWLWEWGDGETSIDENPSWHLYASPGVYHVRLTVSGMAGDFIFEKDIILKGTAPLDPVPSPPVVYFWPDVSYGPSPLTVNFENDPIVCAEGAVIDWDWGDGSAHGTIENPSHVFTGDGNTYYVTLTVTCGPFIVKHTVPITVTTETNPENIPPIITDIYADVFSGYGPLTVNFQSWVTDTPTFEWDFGDGTNCILQNPSHTFYVPGTYEVYLYIYNGFGSTYAHLTIIVLGWTDFDGDDDIGYFIVDAPNNRILIYSLDGYFVDAFGSFGTGDGQFNNPTQITVDVSASRVYVVDSGNNRIQVFDEDGIFLFKWGSLGSGEGQFNRPYGITNDDNFIYVTDSGNNRVQVFTLDGVFVFEFGSYGTGDGEFNNPKGIAVDSNYIYVVDQNNHRIQIFSKVAGEFAAALGSYGSGDLEFKFPTNITLDDNYIYVDDTRNERTVIIPKIQFSVLYDKWNLPDNEDFTFVITNAIDGRELRSLLLEMNITEVGDVSLLPLQLTMNISDHMKPLILIMNVSPDIQSEYIKNPQIPTSGVIYESLSPTSVIYESPADNEVGLINTYLRSWPTQSPSNGTYNLVNGIAVYNDEVFVCEANNYQIEVFNLTGTLLRKWGTKGTGAGEFNSPWLICIYNNEVFVTDNKNGNVQVFDLQGVFKRSWGCLSAMGIFVYNDEVFVTTRNEYICGKIQVFDLNGNLLREWNTPTAANYFSFRWVFGLHIHEDKIYATSSLEWEYPLGYYSLLVYDLNGNLLNSWVGATEPQSPPFVYNNEIYIPSINRRIIQIFDMDGNLLRQWGRWGAGVTERLQWPICTFIYNGEIFITDLGAQKVFVFGV